MAGRCYSFTYHNDSMLDIGLMGVEVIFKRNVSDDEDLQYFMDDVRTMFSKDKRFWIMYDATNVSSVPLLKLQQLNKFMDTQETEANRLVAVTAVVIPNAIVCGAVRKLLMLRKTPFPLKVFNTTGNAREFLVEQIARLSTAPSTAASVSVLSEQKHKEP